MKGSINIGSAYNRKEVVSSMDKSKLRKKRHKKMDKGKGRRLGTFESIALKFIGYQDGHKGLPRLTDENVWYSTYMEREVKSFGEFCSHIWGSLQIENEERYTKLEELMTGIRQKRESLEAAKYALVVVDQNEDRAVIARKNGEDKLTDRQIRVRREAERERRIAPVKSKITDIEHELKELEEAFSTLYSKLVEDNNTTRMICHRVKEHISMRIAIYWNSALMSHPDGGVMPVAPVFDLTNDAEETYLTPHQDLMKRASEVRIVIHEKEEVA